MNGAMPGFKVSLRNLILKSLKALLPIGLLAFATLGLFGASLHYLYHHVILNIAATYSGTLPAYFEQATEVMKTGQASDLWIKITDIVIKVTQTAAKATQQAGDIMTQMPPPASTPLPPCPTCIPCP